MAGPRDRSAEFRQQSCCCDDAGLAESGNGPRRELRGLGYDLCRVPDATAKLAAEAGKLG